MVKFKFSPDVVALGSSGALFFATLVWALWSETAVWNVPTAAGEIGPGVVKADPIGTAGGDRSDGVWPALPVSDDAEVWSFDVFTPPQIYFDRETGRFSVSAPEAVELGDDVLQSPFGISLVAVARQPYRLQLVGYAGFPDEPWGIFANEVTGEGIVAQQGFRFADLGLELVDLEIKREDLIVPESMPLREIVAVAQVRDTQANRTMRLTSGYPAWTDRPTATVRIDHNGAQREVAAGNRLELGDAVVEITGVFANPDAVTAVKLLADGTRESIRLSVDNAGESQFGSDTIFETP